MSIYLVGESRQQRLLDHCFRDLQVSKHCWGHIGGCSSSSALALSKMQFVGREGPASIAAPPSSDMDDSPSCRDPSASGRQHDRVGSARASAGRIRSALSAFRRETGCQQREHACASSSRASPGQRSRPLRPCAARCQHRRISVVQYRLQFAYRLPELGRGRTGLAARGLGRDGGAQAVPSTLNPTRQLSTRPERGALRSVRVFSGWRRKACRLVLAYG
jgi:hypothetical protein